MGLNLHLNDVENIMYESGQHQYTIDEAGIQEMNISYDYKYFKGGYNEIILDNFKIGYGNCKLSQKTTLFFEFDEETVEMHFTLQGNSKTTINTLPNDLFIGQNSHNIFYCITPAMLVIINQIINCSWKNKYRQLFLEAKVLELLLLQLEDIRLCSLCLKKNKTSKTIIDKMHYAKEIVLSKLNNPMCLSDLAKVIGTNECTLKKEFKNVFGYTVFKYITDEKMEKAKMLLEDKQLTVNEVSDISGYKNPQHFSTAFKRKSNIL